MALLHNEDLFFIFLPRDPALWELSNHGLFLQGCVVVVGNTQETQHILLQIKHAPVCPLPLIHKRTKIGTRKPIQNKTFSFHYLLL